MLRYVIRDDRIVYIRTTEIRKGDERRFTEEDVASIRIMSLAEMIMMLIEIIESSITNTKLGGD